MKQRIGFCCKFLLNNNTKKTKEVAAQEKLLNTGGTTVAWLNRQTVAVAEDKLWQVMAHNLESVKRVLQKVKDFDSRMHMMRIGSDLLPMYTEPTWRYFWQKSDVKAYYSKHFAEIGAYAREHDIRLSFHPGQFCCLASNNPDIVARSIDEFEYHVDMARMMGYGSSWHDHGFKINVHIAGKLGPDGIIHALKAMSQEARNLITIENDEMTWGIEDSLKLVDHVALVLDIHHHMIHSNGELINPQDPRWELIEHSWRGVRPVIHYSLSREDVLINDDTSTMPNWQELLVKYNRTKLRAHSNDCWIPSMNDWALKFLPYADIQVEAKLKNIASQTLLNHYDSI